MSGSDNGAVEFPGKRRRFVQMSVLDTLRSAPWKYARLLPALLVFAQIIVLRELSLLKYMPLRASPDFISQLLSALPAIVKSSIVTGVAALCIAIFRDRPENRREILAVGPEASIVIWNLLCFVALCVVVIAIKPDNGELPRVRHLVGASAFLWVGMIVSWGVMVAPSHVWRQISRQYLSQVAIIFGMSVISFYYLEGLITGASGAFLVEPTVALSGRLFSLTGEKLDLIERSADGTAIVGNDLFKVEITPACSGYQGMSLSALFFVVYFYFERRKFSVLRVALIVLAGGAAVYVLNAVRIAALFYIGEHFSAEVAVNGFHTNFGLLSVILVSLSTVALAPLLRVENGAAYAHVGADRIYSRDAPDRTAMLLPLVFLIGASLFTGLFSGKFAWLYPLPILAATIGLLAIRGDLVGLIKDISPVAILLGALVFGVWIVLVPVDPDASQAFENRLFSASPLLAGSWLFFRLIGSVVVVPLAEELAFRGAFQELLFEALCRRFGVVFSNYFALFLTSIGFGLMHTNILAGSLAGVAFGIARLFRGRLGDAVVAHATTNLALALHVLLGSHWSYWG